MTARVAVAAVVVVAFVAAAGPVRAAPPAVGFDGDPATTQRLDGATPAAVAVQVSRASFEADAAQQVVLSRDDAFADSLAGSALTIDGPLLLTPSAALDPAARAELDRVLPSDGVVLLLGGTAALAAGIAQELAAAGYEVRRLAGATRVETAVAVADALLAQRGDGFRAAVARSTSPADNPTAAWADSVAAGWFAAADGVPILLTPTDQLHPAVAAWLAAHTIDFTFLLGGRSALSDTVAAAVTRPVRLSGSERAGTAAAVVRKMRGLFGAGPRRFVIIDGYRADGWAYGLASAGLAARAGAQTLLSNGEGLPPATAALVGACRTAMVDLVLAGGDAAVTPAAASLLDALDGQPCDTGPSAFAVQVGDQIQAELAAAGAPDLVVSCEPPAQVARRTEMPCALDFADPNPDDFGLVVVRDDAGHWNVDIGTGIERSGAEVLANYGAGRSCADLAEAGAPYFTAVLYWFAEGEQARMDADGNGIPCETVYPTEDVQAYWA